jgi:hypothetical protein
MKEKRYGATRDEVMAYNLGIIVGFMASHRARQKDTYNGVRK